MNAMFVESEWEKRLFLIVITLVLVFLTAIYLKLRGK